MPDTNQSTIFNAFFRMNSRDPSDLPSPPILSKFDERVLKLCGDWGGKPTADEFVAMLTEPEHKDVVNSIYESLEHTVITKNANMNTFIIELAQVWFGENGFKHIFGGEPRTRTLNGLHYAPRLYQAQQNRWAGLGRLGYQLSTGSSMYKLDVKYQDPKGKIKSKLCGSFDKTLHADDILIYGTLAFKMTKENNKEVDYALNGYVGRFVKRNNAILTFFPKLIEIPLTPDSPLGSPEIFHSLETDGAMINDDYYRALRELIGNITKSVAIEPGTTQSRAK